MNVNHLSADLQAVRTELRATKDALIATRALLFAALEQLQQQGHFDPSTVALPADAQRSEKMKAWLTTAVAAKNAAR